MQATVHGVAQSQTRLSDFTSLKRVEKVRGKAAAAAAKLLQWCPTLCDPIDGSPLGSSVPGILQARILEWVAIFLQCMKVKSESEVTQLCLTLSDQARVLEWGAIVFSGEGRLPGVKRAGSPSNPLTLPANRSESEVTQLSFARQDHCQWSFPDIPDFP